VELAPYIGEKETHNPCRCTSLVESERKIGNLIDGQAPLMESLGKESSREETDNLHS
jgi:hypothetical protein